MTPFSQLLDSISPAGAGRWSVNASDDWRQGRTLYGGISAAFCHAACEQFVPGLPPLRSGQIAFVGPATGESILAPSILRQGKSVSVLACDLIADGNVATRALFAFGEARPSSFDIDAAAAPNVAGPEACQSLFGDRHPAFAVHFDLARRQGRCWSGCGIVIRTRRMACLRSSRWRMLCRPRRCRGWWHLRRSVQ